MNPLEEMVSKFKKKHPNQMPVSEKIQNSLISHVYHQAKVGFLGSIACAIIVFISMHHTEYRANLYSWAGIFLLITGIRLTLVNFYLSVKEPDKKLSLWRNLFIAGSIMGGISWGLSAFLLYPYADGLQQTLIVLILAGVTAGAVPLVSAVLPAAVAFTVTAVGPLCFMLLYSQMNYLFNFSLVIYIFYLIIIAKNTNKMIVNTISLQFENHTLLTNLSYAKSQLELINQKLEQAASHDPLTNVANRNLFILNFGEAIQRAKQTKKLLALLYIDLDNFKNVNDVYGHHIGDQILLILVDRIEQIIEDLDAISRLGGDEFTILVEGVTTPQEVATLAEKLCAEIAKPVIVNGLELFVSASIGISVYPLDGDNAEKLLNVADRAMYYVKENGGNNFRFNVTLSINR